MDCLLLGLNFTVPIGSLNIRTEQKAPGLLQETGRMIVMKQLWHLAPAEAIPHHLARVLYCQDI